MTMRDGDDDEERRGPGAWIAAAILIGVGIIFLLQNMGYPMPGNWWALFLLIPAAGAFWGAWQTYDDAGRHYTNRMNGSLIAGFVLLAIGVIFLFDLDVPWGLVWPIILILIGAIALWRAYSR